MQASPRLRIIAAMRSNPGRMRRRLPLLTSSTSMEPQGFVVESYSQHEWTQPQNLPQHHGYTTLASSSSPTRLGARNRQSLLASSLSSSIPQSAYPHLHHNHLFLHNSHQFRSYVFLPTSWAELKLTLEQQYCNQKDQYRKTIKVKLWRERTEFFVREKYRRAKAFAQRTYEKAYDSAHTHSATHGQTPTLQQHYLTNEQQSNYDVSDSRNNSLSTSTSISQSTGGQTAAPLSSTLPKPTRSARLARYSRQAMARFKHRILSSALVKPVQLTEYAEADWFDAAGRPLASRDPTGRFVNPWMSQSTNGVHTLETLLRWRWGRFQREWDQFGWGIFLPTFWKSDAPSDAISSYRPKTVPIPSQDQTAAGAIDPSSLRCTLIGHATCWVQKGSVNILTDPHFSNRASPFQNTPIGVARDFPPACQIDDLPDMDVCLISHDHYDHLDKESVRQLRDKVQLWAVPTGIGEWLQEKADIPEERIVELSWWESARVVRNPSNNTWTVAERHALQEHHDQFTVPRHPSVEQPATQDQLWITACPTQHWSSRTFFDRNRRLWASFAVFLDQSQTFYFAGDTGLPTEFPLFEQISDYLGRPIDLAALPIGAYDPEFYNQDSHINPSEAVEIHRKLHCRQSVAVHHNAFPLGEEPHDEPARLLAQATAKAGIDSFDVVPNGGSVSVPALIPE